MSGKRNPILAELESLLDPGLPARFTLWVPDAWMVGPLKAGLVFAPGNQRVPETTKSVVTRLLDYDITLRADSDPDPFALVH